MRKRLQGDILPSYLTTAFIFLAFLFGFLAPINKAHDFREPQKITKPSRHTASTKQKGRIKSMLASAYTITGDEEPVNGQYLDSGSYGGTRYFFSEGTGYYLFFNPWDEMTGNWVLNTVLATGAGQYTGAESLPDDITVGGWRDPAFEFTVINIEPLENPPAPELSGLSRLNEFNAPELVVYGGSGTP